MLRMLHEESFDLHVYSSAAKDLQKDLFAHTIDGDISTVSAYIHVAVLLV